MASFLPALKVALYISQIVTAAAPMFTSRTANGNRRAGRKANSRIAVGGHTKRGTVKLMATQERHHGKPGHGCCPLAERGRVLRRVAYGSAIVAVLAVLLALVAITGN